MSRTHEEEQKPAAAERSESKPIAHHGDQSKKDAATVDRVWNVKTDGPAPAYLGDALTPMFTGLTNQVDSALRELDVDIDTEEHRMLVVERVSRELAEASIMMAALLDDRPAQKEYARYRAFADRTAHSVGKVLGFIRSRTPHKELEQRFLVGARAFDKVLAKLGTPDIASRDAAALSNRATNTSKLEETEVKDAEGRMQEVLTKLESAEAKGLNLFYEIAKKDDIEEPPFVEELLKAALIGTLSVVTEGLLDGVIAAIGGRGASAAVHATTHASAAAGEHAMHGAAHNEEMLKKLLSTTSEELIQGQVEKKGEHGTEPRVEKEGASRIDQKQRALTYFWAGLGNASTNRHAAYKRTLTTLTATSSVSEAELNDMELALSKVAASLSDRVRNQSSLSWAKYLAQSHLGTHYAGNDKVVNMAGYFGKPERNGRAFGTNRSGGDGILSIRFEIAEPGERPRLDHEFTKVVGLNSELKNYIVADASNKFGGVSLPKEVHVQHRFAHAIIALDETNRIRDVWNWDEIEPYVGESAATFWKHWGGTELEIK